MKVTFFAAVSACLMVLATAGCSTPSAPSEPSLTPTSMKAQAMNQGQLCDTLAAFFADELRVVDLQTQPLRARDTVISPGGICDVAQGGERVGRWESLHTMTRPDPTEGVPGYKEIAGGENPVFFYDRRDDGFGVRFATRFGEWNARLFVYTVDIRTADGLLDIDDENMHKCAEFIVELTRKLAAMPL
ncbi:hypothetical protein ACFC06_13220 [Nocardia sp. NPDC056064]|uniref:hypothetical protein n=1 Tax=Nocardia sp. NPDC056064 TaxID=3345701 RepID=UPI0035E0FC02